MTTDFNERARRLRNAVEPVAAGVYFAPETHAAYAAIGFDANQVVGQDGITPPDLKSYFTVVPAVEAGWQVADRDAILEARLQAAPATYPKRVAGVYNVGGGPHFGSGLTIDTAAEQAGAKD